MLKYGLVNDYHIIAAFRFYKVYVAVKNELSKKLPLYTLLPDQMYTEFTSHSLRLTYWIISMCFDENEAYLAYNEQNINYFSLLVSEQVTKEIIEKYVVLYADSFLLGKRREHARKP